MRRRVALAAAGSIAVAGVGGAWVAGALANGDGAAAADPVGPPNTAEVITTDLVEETEHDATLGRTAGDPIRANRDGIVTGAPAAGSTVGNGEVLYRVDGEPVVALIGETPAYRALTAYPEPASVGAPADGVITWLPDIGAEIGPGSVLMRVDDKPVIALVGDVPAYRDLRDLPANMTGDDVLQLEQNLVAMGLADAYDVEVDGEFDWRTADAVEALQEWNGADDDGALNLGEFVVIDAPTTVVDVALEVGDRVSAGGDGDVLTLAEGERLRGDDVAQLNAALAALGHLSADELAAQTADEFGAATDAALREFQAAAGMDVDGVLDIGEIVFIPEPVRIATVDAAVGSSVSPGTQVLGVTGEAVAVTFNLPAEDQGDLAVGDEVTVELPDGSDVSATVTAVATVATVVDNSAVFEVEVALDESAADRVVGLDAAPVEVAYVSEAARGVTAVPVAALVALREGGYAVERFDGATTQLVAVTPGFFAGGLVEVTGEIVAGDLVVVP